MLNRKKPKAFSGFFLKKNVGIDSSFLVVVRGEDYMDLIDFRDDVAT